MRIAPSVRHLVLPVIILALGAGGCRRNKGGNDDDPPPGGDPDPTGEKTVYEAELWEGTRALDETAGAEIVAAGAGFLEIKAGGSLAGVVAAGDILLLPVTEATPAGGIVLVEAVTAGPDSVRLGTSVAPLQAAYKKLKISATRVIPSLAELAPDDGGALTTPDGGRLVLGGASGSLKIDWYAYNADNDVKTEEDQVHVVGELGGGLTYDFDLDFDWGGVSVKPTPPFVDLPEVKVTFTLKAEAKTSLAMVGAASKTFSRKDTLWSKPLKPFPVGPLWFFPELDLVSVLEGGASSSFNLSTSAGITSGVNLGWSSSGAPDVSLIPPEVTSEAPTATVKGTAFVEGRIGPRLSLKIYKVAGPYATLTGFARLEADRSLTTGCWSAKAGMRGDIGLHVGAEILGHKVSLVDWGTGVDLASFDLGSGDCDLSGAVAIPGGVADEEPKFTPWSTAVRDSWVNPAERMATLTDVDGGLVVAGVWAKTVTKFHPGLAGKALWSRRLVMPHKGGDSEAYLQSLAYVPEGAGYLVGTSAPTGLAGLTHDAAAVSWAYTFDVDYVPPQQDLVAIGDDSAGGYYLYGAIPQTDSDSRYDVWLVKVNAKGEIAWQKRGAIDGGTEEPTGLLVTKDGILMMGYSGFSDPSPSWYGWLRYLDLDGAVRWEKRLTPCTAGERMRPLSGLRTKDGDLLVGAAMPYGTFSAKAVLMKLKPDGSVGYVTGNSATYDGQNFGMLPQTLWQAGSGNIFLGGSSFTLSTEHNHMWVMRADAGGRAEWLTAYAGTADAGATPEGAAGILASTDDNGLVVATTSRLGMSDTQGPSTWLMKVPLKTGAITFNGASGAQTRTLPYVVQESACVNLEALTMAWTDAAVKATAVTATIKDVAVDSLTAAP